MDPMNKNQPLSGIKYSKVPLFLEGVSAGFPSPAADHIEKTLDLNELCISRPAATFFVRADGDSMKDAGIHSGDILIVDRSIDVCHGHIVIAAVDGDFLCKRIDLNSDDAPRLLAENPDYAPIPITDDLEVSVFGVVTHAIHNFLMK